MHASRLHNADTRSGWRVRISNALTSSSPIDEVSKDLEGLPLHLLFFAADEGDDVVEDTEAGYAGVCRARDGLHGGNDAQFDRTNGFFERAEGYDEARGGAVCVGEDEALLEGRIRGSVDEWDNEGDMGVAAVVFGVGEDGEVGVSKGALHWAC